jgi:hypothetical protein
MRISLLGMFSHNTGWLRVRDASVQMLTLAQKSMVLLEVRMRHRITQLLEKTLRTPLPILNWKKRLLPRAISKLGTLSCVPKLGQIQVRPRPHRSAHEVWPLLRRGVILAGQARLASEVHLVISTTTCLRAAQLPHPAILVHGEATRASVPIHHRLGCKKLFSMKQPLVQQSAQMLPLVVFLSTKPCILCKWPLALHHQRYQRSKPQFS